MTWPPNVPEQTLLLDAIERELDTIEGSSNFIYIASTTRPTRGEWETQYERISGQRPPIPPGVYLCWYDMRSAQVRLNMTAFDTGNGSLSTGDIYPVASPPQTYHYLGRIDRSGRYQDAKNPIPNWEAYRAKGLRAVRIYCTMAFGDQDVYLRLFTKSKQTKEVAYGHYVNASGFGEMTTADIPIRLIPDGPETQEFSMLLHWPAGDNDIPYKTIAATWQVFGEEAPIGGYKQIDDFPFFAGFQFFAGDNTNSIFPSDNSLRVMVIRGWVYGQFSSPVNEIGFWDGY